MTVIPVSNLLMKSKSNLSISIQEKISESLEKSQTIDLSNLIELDLPPEVLNRMFDHQKEGVAWMFNLHKNNLGGILGDGNLIILTLTIKIYTAVL